MSRTVYLSPPKAHKPKRVSQADEFKNALFRYRAGWLPFGVGVALWVVSSFAGLVSWGPAVLAVAGLALAAGLVQSRYEPPDKVPWFRLDRPVEHAYAAGCAITGTVWATYATSNPSGSPGWRATGILVCLIMMCAAPWWNHRRIRGSIPVRFDNLPQRERQRRLNEARMLIREWTAFTSAAHVNGAKLKAITFNPWSFCLAVQLRRGATITEFTPLRLAKLESAAADVDGVVAGSARVERIERHARLALLRFMVNDPHAEPIKRPLTGQGDAEKIVLGLFETGEEVLFRLVNTLIAGLTGSGKSGLVNMIIRSLASIPTVAIVGIDMKPGAPELGPWRKSMHALATNADEARAVLDRLKAGLEYRGAVMQANGWRKWKPTREHPFIVLIVDEVQELKSARLAKKLDEVAAIIRAYGGAVVIATQYPTKENVSPTIKGNCPQKIGCRVEDAVGDRVIFGESASRNGWRASLIDSEREGSFLIRSPIYKRPVLARAFWMDDEDVAADADALAPFRTAIDAGTWTVIDNPATMPAVESGPVADDDPEIIDAEIVDDDPAQRVLAALRVSSKIKVLLSITGMSRATLNRHLAALRDQGLAENASRGVWTLTAAGEGESKSGEEDREL